MGSHDFPILIMGIPILGKMVFILRQGIGANMIAKSENLKKCHQHNIQCCQASNIRHTLGNEIVDNSEVVGASPAGTAPTYIFILNLTPGFNGLGKENCKTRWETFNLYDLVQLILEIHGTSQELCTCGICIYMHIFAQCTHIFCHYRNSHI